MSIKEAMNAHVVEFVNITKQPLYTLHKVIHYVVNAGGHVRFDGDHGVLVVTLQTREQCERLITVYENTLN